METDYRPDTKEHGHLFLGQKSNGSYGAVVPMLHWYATRDKDFAKREYYDFLLSVADFWEDYLVFEDGVYHSYNDALHEVAWYVGPDYVPGKPEGLDDKDPLLSMCLIRMLMGMLIDISQELGENTHRIPKWKHILEHVAERGTFEQDGVTYLACKDGGNYLDELVLECTYPMGQFGQYITPELYEVARNTHRKLAIWDSHNRFCSYYPMAARLEYPPEEIIARIHTNIEKHGLPNGMFRFAGGGLENSAAIPMTVNEMLLQSYEGILRLFPVWDKKQDARFRGLRAYGAFVVDAGLENGRIRAEILSEKGMPLTIESPGSDYILFTGDGTAVPLTEQFTTVNTVSGERLIVTPNT
jgi:hypothetical protein